MFIILVESISWIGAIAVLLQYYMTTTKKMEVESLRYQFLTLTCNVFFTFYNLYKEAYSFSVINFLFSVIAVVSIYFIYKKRGFYIPLLTKSYLTKVQK